MIKCVSEKHLLRINSQKDEILTPEPIKHHVDTKAVKSPAKEMSGKAVIAETKLDLCTAYSKVNRVSVGAAALLLELRRINKRSVDNLRNLCPAG